jgi:antitoxin (DNA-binding transcriptional repressor) of toxin-antitoxin stability system
MKNVASFEMRAKLSRSLGSRESVEEITVTRHGARIARLIPDDPSGQRSAN